MESSRKNENNEKLNGIIFFLATVAIIIALVAIAKGFAGKYLQTSASKQVGTETDMGVQTSAVLTTESESTEPSVSMDTQTQTETGTEDSEAVEKTDPVKVRGIYVTGPTAGSAAMEELISLLDETELNTMVIDVKNDDGTLSYQMDLDSVSALDACVNYVGDMTGLLEELKAHDIYTIARIVCFKDDCLARGRDELALKTADGTPVTDANGIMWVNPYSKEVWSYLTEIAQEALDTGFNEVQFDYVRFPVGTVADAAQYGVDMEQYPKEEAIRDFLSYVKENINEGAIIGADLFGTVIGSEVDKERVGQDYKKLAETVDVLCPMVYPSHYAEGVFGLSVPDAYPYETVYGALLGSVEELAELEEQNRAIVRPWLQSFTATWVEGHISYNGEQIQKQIQAVYDAGYEEWILWNASNRYSSDGLLTQEE